MTRPTAILREAARTAFLKPAAEVTLSSAGGSSSSEGRSAGQALSRRDLQRKYRDSKYVVVNGVPRTATPSDVRRALIEHKLVGANFPITAITASAISLPRGPRLSQAYHIECRDAVTAAAIARATASVQGGSPLFPGFNHHDGRSGAVLTSAKEWQEMMYEAHETVVQKRAARGGRTGEQLQAKSFKYDLQRLAVGRDKDLSGKRVLVAGFPSREPRVHERTVREFVTREILGRDEVGVAGSETGLVSGPENVIPLPSSTQFSSRMFCLTFESVQHACRAVRKLNMIPYTQDMERRYGSNAEPDVIRAEMIW